MKKLRFNLVVLAAISLFVSVSFALAQTPQAQTGQSEAPPPPQPASAPVNKTPAKKMKKKPPTHTVAAKKPQSPKKKPAAEADSTPSAEPDKVLYDRAQEDLKHSRYTEGRLALQTLINTYPDSEYLAKAKLAIADSYYKEGGTENLTEAVNQYKDFITFFPFLDEAAYAQLQVGMAHYKMMEKADRDQTEAENAESELQTFLLKYPQSPLAPKAEQDLRNVQEILADGDFEVGRFYFLRGDYRAAGPRLYEITSRYPLFSESDQALWMLGTVYEKAEKRDLADRVYSAIIREYPLSPLAPDAKKKLIDANVPVPQPDPLAVARMKKDEELEQHSRTSTLVHLPMDMLHSRPDVSMAAHSGTPNLQPPDDTISAADILKPGAAPVGAITVQASAGSADSAVETVPAGATLEQVNGGSPPENNPTTRGLPDSGIPSPVSGSSGQTPTAQSGSDSSVPQPQTGGESSTPQPQAGGDSSSPQPQTGSDSGVPQAQTGGNSTPDPSSASASAADPPENGSQAGAAGTQSQSDGKQNSDSKKKSDPK